MMELKKIIKIHKKNIVLIIQYIIFFAERLFSKQLFAQFTYDLNVAKTPFTINIIADNVFYLGNSLLKLHGFALPHLLIRLFIKVPIKKLLTLILFL